MDKDNNNVINDNASGNSTGARKSQAGRWNRSRRQSRSSAEAAGEVASINLQSSPVDVIKNLARNAKKTVSAPLLGLAADVQPLDELPAETKSQKRAPKREGEAAARSSRRGKGGRSKENTVKAAAATEKKAVETKAMEKKAEISVEKPAVKEKSKVRPTKEGGKKERQDSGRHKLSIIPLGGLGEVGKNMTAFRYGNDIIVIDAGMTFPDEELLGIDLVIPDYNYLMENRHMVRGIFVTHGHEDHIGALPYVLKDLKVPVYGSRLTIGLLRGKLKEHNLGNAQLHDVVAGDTISIGPFKVEFIHVSHSIPDSMALAIHTPVGICLHTGDFKVDMSPIDDQFMDLTRISELGQEGVLLLMADSTNVEKEGFTPSEKSVGQSLDSIFLNATGRIIVTTFASNVHRIQQAIWAAERTGRKVALVGRSMNNVVAVSRELGYLKAKANTFIDITDIKKYPDRKVTVLTTGSQGETLAGLTRMSQGEHRQVHLRKGDLVVISAYPIPGNEKMISKTVDNLYHLGVDVIYGRSHGIHVSGHASQEDLKLLFNLVRPKFFMPVHGEYRMLCEHAKLANRMGISEKNTFIMENGMVLELTAKTGRINGAVHAGRVLIDGRGIGDVGATVLKDRKQLSSDGIVIASIVVDRERDCLNSMPYIFSRGFVYEKGNDTIFREAEKRILNAFEATAGQEYNLSAFKASVKSIISKLCYERTGRKPIVVPIIHEI